MVISPKSLPQCGCKKTQTSRSLSQAPKATSFHISLVGNYPWKEELKTTSPTMVDILRENTDMANMGELRTLMQDGDGWNLLACPSERLGEGVSES